MATPPDPAVPAHEALLRDFDAGRRAALARVISIVENETPGFRGILRALHGRLGRAHRIGVTGPPGAGKSTLTAALVKHWRAAGETVGVVAVDPTSPYTGGALLGDRIRMNELALDSGVFIRSMATRGSLGGLALTTKEVTDVLDAFGFDRVLVETVGVGQSELDIAATADSTVVIVVPESGDSIQAMKAGLFEAADLFVVNKADRPGAERMARELSTMLHLRHGRALRNVPAHHGVDLRRAGRAGGGAAGASEPAAEDAGAVGWEVPVLQTVAHAGRGVPELAGALEGHRVWLAESGERTRRFRARLADRVREEVDRRLRVGVWGDGHARALLEAALPALESGATTPYDVAAQLTGGGAAAPGPD
jgi:LAO/AO transport system kinase